MKKTIQQHKIDATLDKVERYPEGVMTRREWLKIMQAKGWTADAKQVPKVQYNRIKFNRMSWEEQIEYEKKMQETKTQYELISGSSFYTITKTEYDYFQSLQLEHDINTEKFNLPERIEAGLATDQEIKEDQQQEFDFFNRYN